ncbi:sporulation protein YpjB [Priestia abyssalis]|uniref:sporulation protein YpjB n=1 Tax=Priestia abyssalis TaxID=1221450 RepID=UPI00099570BF|nr:sporulation protein YpjB [Priestia abyssalis]
MKGKIIVMVMLILLSLQPLTYAETINEGVLNELSDEVLQLTKQERYEEAAALLEQFPQRLEQSRHDWLKLSPENIRMLTVIHEEASAALKTDALEKAEKVRKVTSFRLLVDALQSEHQPLWTEMEGTIMGAFSQLKTTVSTGDERSFEDEYHSFLSQYEMILPSVQVDIRKEYVQRMDAHLAFLNSPSSINEQSRLKQLEQMEQDLQNLFHKMKEEEISPSLIWMMATTGSIIVLTLSYVAWRKYNGDKVQYTTP